MLYTINRAYQFDGCDMFVLKPTLVISGFLETMCGLLLGSFT
jgi:hypothetical protein